jgi:hypothetical protein
MHEDGMSAAIEMCIGVVSAVRAGVAAVALGVLALGRWATPTELASPARSPSQGRARTRRAPDRRRARCCPCGDVDD